MRAHSPALALTAAVALFLGPLNPAVADMKCWTNKDGVRECGNIVPPEYAQQEQTEISETGITTGHTERAKTPEELEQARKEAAAKAEAEKLASERAAADRELLGTYGTEEDIVLVRDAKIADVESYIKISKNHVEKLNKNLNDLLQQAAAMEQRGEPPGENTARDIESVRKQIREQEALITSKRADQEAIRKKYDADLARYRDIKSKAAAAASGEPDDTATAEAKSP